MSHHDYTYSHDAYQIARQITGRYTGAINRRYCKVDPARLAQVKYETGGNYGEYWDKVTHKQRRTQREKETIATLHYIVGDSW